MPGIICPVNAYDPRALMMPIIAQRPWVSSAFSFIVFVLSLDCVKG